MSREEKLIWYPLTPGSVPAGARISAGKWGSVARSFPTMAVVSANWVPVSCIPSPESPANRMTTVSISWIRVLGSRASVWVLTGNQAPLCTFRLPHDLVQPRRQVHHLRGKMFGDEFDKVLGAHHSGVVPAVVLEWNVPVSPLGHQADRLAQAVVRTEA